MPTQILYKFRSWSDLNQRRSLLHKEIYFASPSQFNDPFDCFINYRYDLLSQEEKFKKYYQMTRAQDPLLSDDEVKRKAKKWLKEGLLEKDKLLENNKIILRELINEQVGILSLTKTKEHILLWSHYSDSHRGFCLGYNLDILKADLATKYNKIEKIFYDVDVEYLDKYPIIIPTDNISPSEYIKIPFRTKAKFWEYEQEHRIFILGGPKEVTSLPADAIAEVIIGCNMPEKDKLEIEEFAIKSLPHASLYIAEMHHESFKLVFKKIN